MAAAFFARFPASSASRLSLLLLSRETSHSVLLVLHQPPLCRLYTRALYLVRLWWWCRRRLVLSFRRTGLLCLLAAAPAVMEPSSHPSTDGGRVSPLPLDDDVAAREKKKGVWEAVLSFPQSIIGASD